MFGLKGTGNGVTFIETIFGLKHVGYVREVDIIGCQDFGRLV